MLVYKLFVASGRPRTRLKVAKVLCGYNLHVVFNRHASESQSSGYLYTYLSC
jgi:hypothetical protein